jgi:hypothetical protein
MDILDECNDVIDKILEFKRVNGDLPGLPGSTYLSILKEKLKKEKEEVSNVKS